MLFLAKVKIRKYEYMCDSTDFEKNHLVEADDESSAKEKVQVHYENKGSDYDTNYSVLDIEIAENII